MSGRVQSNSSTIKNRKPRKERIPRPSRDHSTESTRSARSDFYEHSIHSNRGKDEDRKKDFGGSKRGSRSPRRGREYGKEILERCLPSSKSRSRRDDIKPSGGKLENLSYKSKDTGKGHISNERHPLFQDNSRLAQLIGQLTNSHDEYPRRLSSAKQLQEYLCDSAHLEPIKRNSSSLFAALGDVLCERGHNELKDLVITSLGTIGHLLGIDCDRLFKWIFAKFPSAANEQVGVLYLKVLLEALRLDVNKQVFSKSMPMLMRNLLEVLENADTPDLLVVIMDIVSMISMDYPQYFSEYFRDTVDILVGWHIDTTQTEKLMKETSDCLVGFHAYWVSDMVFSLMLLSQFLEDMEAYAEELNGISQGEFETEDMPSPFVSLPKLNALVQVYTTVVSGIGDYFVPGRGGQVTSAFVDKTIARIIECVDICGYKFRFEKLLISANNCLTVMVRYLGGHFANSANRVITFLAAQLKSSSCVTYMHVRSILTLLDRIFSVMGASLSHDSIHTLLEKGSPFLQLRLLRNEEIYLMLTRAFQLLIGIKNIAFVQEAYKFIVEDLKEAYESLVVFCGGETDEDGDKTVELKGEANDAHEGIQNEETLEEGEEIIRSVEEQKHLTDLQKIIIFDLSVLAEIATVKSPVVGAWQVDPPTFELLTSTLNPMDVNIAQMFPLVQYCILSTLFIHSQRSNHYIPVSTTKTFASVHEFLRIAKVLCFVLKHPTFSLDCRCLCLLWLTDVVSVIQSLPKDQIRKQVPLKELMEVAIVAGFSAEESLRKEGYACIQALLKIGCIPVQAFHRALVESLVHLDDMDDGIKHLFCQLLLKFPVDVIAGLSSGISQGSKMKELGMGEGLEMTSKRDIWLAKKIHMSRLPTVLLHSHQFKVIMSRLLLGGDKSCSSTWIEELAFSCQRLGKVSGMLCQDFSVTPRFGRGQDSALPINSGCSESLLWFWAIWEAAQLCVLSRLKTPLGKATDTFHAVEAVIRGLEKELTGTTQQSDDADAVMSPPDPPQEGEEGVDATKRDTGFSKLEQSVLVLQFLANLEKLMYNAYEGSAVSLPQPSKGVRTFFRTNRATCQDWLSRMRESATHLSVACRYAASAAHHGFLWLQGLQAAGNFQGTEFERAVTLVVIALCQLHAWESVTGILEWCKKVAGRNFFWLSGMVPLARGNLERASELLKTGFEQYLSPDRQRNENAVENKKSVVTVLTKEPVIHANAMVTHALLSEVLDCYMKLGDWEEVQSWAKNVQEWHEKLPGVDGLDSSFDINLVRALSRFEDNDFPGVREMLDLVPGATMGEIMQEQFPVLGAVVDEREVRSLVNDTSVLEDVFTRCKRRETPNSFLCQSQTNLLQAVTLYWTSGLNTLKGSRVGSLHSSTWESVEDLLNRARDLMFTCIRVCQLTDSADTAAPFIMQLQCINAIGEALLAGEEDLEIKASSLNVSEQNVPLNPSRTDISVLSNAIRTASYIQFHRSRHKKGWVEPTVMAVENVPDIGSFRVLTAKVARKQGNIKLAEALLAKQLAFSESKGSGEGKLPFGNSAQLKLKQLSNSVHSGRISNPLAAVEILVESAKLKRLLGNQGEAVESLCSAVLLAEKQFLISCKSIDIHKLSGITAKSVLTLSKWLQFDPRLVTPAGSEIDEHLNVGIKVREVVKAIQKSCGFSTKLLQNGNSPSMTLSETDKICGQLLNYSTHRSPQFGKSWYAFADWCYKWGKKAVEQASFVGRIELTDDEREQAIKVLPEGIGKDTVDTILGILSKAHCTSKGISAEEDITATELLESISEDDEGVRRQLLVACPQVFQDRDLMDVFVRLSNGIVDRLFSHYRHAVMAYFTYVRLVGSEASVDEGCRNEYGNITATLRLLRILVKYSGELKMELDSQLKETPTRPWQGIIPQLFARLNHPEPYVQNSVATLLCRIARDSPHLIVYQTVVGCSELVPAQLSKSSAAGVLKGYKLLNTPNLEQPQNDVVDTPLEQETEEAAVDSQEDAPDVTPSEEIMQSSLHTILDVLKEDNHLLVSEVQKIVQELRRITVLWDELWIGSLLQLHHEAQRRIPQLEEEIQRVHANDTLTPEQKISLIKEKHSALMRPIIYSLERLVKITSQTPETPHEENFQKTFGQGINQAIEKLKNPDDPSQPAQNWEPMKQLHSALQSRAQRRSASNLVMEDISPTLARSKFSLVPMPGVSVSEDQVITLDAFSTEVVILPTKTKPKKLVMIGSDGQRYTYLFKGLEDLHLDERIMQFLEICNHMFAKEDRSFEKRHIARRYSVTPLGPRSGLIQWVDGATPIFALYKRWQQREAAAQSAAKAMNKEEKHGPVQHHVLTRPSELFYSRMAPLLKEKGISDSSANRKEWPISILRNVYSELLADTPNDLLSRELWCSSTGVSDWWEIFQTYSRSAAVMSVIGYIIGLGDRHLDNILVDLSTGEVVHIDYNVCFEKGKALRVPERVPFRMTQNLETALGITGVEGLFRITCEKVMYILRHGKETLLTLLEAFVYDPLVDWTTANDAAFAGAFYGGGAGGDEGNKLSKKEMERSITRTLLSTRIAEMKVSWTGNKDQLHAALSTLSGVFDTFMSAVDAHQTLKRDFGSFQYQMDLLQAALQKRDHPLHSLQARYDKQAKLLADLKSVKEKLAAKLEDCENFHNEHKIVFAKIRSKDIAAIYSGLCDLQDTATQFYSPASSFLLSAGQSSLVSQCDQMEKEMVNLDNQRKLALKGCLDAIVHYSNVTSQFPDNYPDNTWCRLWIPWLHYLMEELTIERCKEVEAKHAEVAQLFAIHVKELEPIVVSMEERLRNYHAEQKARVLKLCERRSQEVVETSALSGPVTETWNALRRFVGETNVSGATSLACVTITALSTLNRRYLVMENAATVASDRLMYLTSRDGDWFLDELCTMCGNIAQLLSVLKNNPMRSATKNSALQEQLNSIANCMQVVFASVKVYASLQELYANFRAIIVPETVKELQNKDASVLQMIESVNALVSGSALPLSSIADSLLAVITNGETESAGELNDVVHELRKELERISEPEGNEENENGDEESGSARMTPGQMLIAGFSGLFTKVDNELNTLYELFRKLSSVDGAEHIDLFVEQKNLKMSKKLCNLPSSAWSNLLFVKRLQVIHGFFTSSLQQAGATKDIENLVNILNKGLNGFYDNGIKASFMPALKVFNEDLLVLPVKQFIADVVQLCIVGIPSVALTYLITQFIHLLSPPLGNQLVEGEKGIMFIDEICKKMVEYNLRNATFPHQHLSQASTLINAHDVAWRKHDLARRLDAAIVSHKDIADRSLLQLARFQWLYEDSLSLGAKRQPAKMIQPSRKAAIADVEKRLQAVSLAEGNLSNLMERFLLLQSSIEQRLKWAAGANPKLNSVLKNFEAAAAEAKALLSPSAHSAPEIKQIAGAIIRLEAFRHRSAESCQFDTTIVKVLVRCGECCEALESCTGELGDVEQLMNNLQISIPPKEPITADWMKARIETIEKKVKSLHVKDGTLRASITTERENLRSQSSIVKSLLNGHHLLVCDVKSMLKALAKDDEAPECYAVRSFIALHNSFTEEASSLIKRITNVCNIARASGDEQDKVTLNIQDDRDMLPIFKDLTRSLQHLHDLLLSFGSNAVKEDQVDVAEPRTFASALRKRSALKVNADETTTQVDVTVRGEDGLPWRDPYPGGPLSTSPPGMLRTSLAAQSPKKTPAGPARDPKTGKAIQERNSYAVNVWRRVKAKLEGRDVDVNHRMTIPEQVDFIINESTNVDNLCQLYEGWTPWV